MKNIYQNVWRALSYDNLHKLHNYLQKSNGHSYVKFFRQQIRHFHVSHNALYLPPTTPPPTPNFAYPLFPFLLGITTVPREIENNAYAFFSLEGRGGGANKVHYGKCGSGEQPIFSVMYGSEADGDLVLIQICQLYCVNEVVLMLTGIFQGQFP